MKRMILCVTVCLLSALLNAGETPKNIILMVGDGMGVAHLTSAKITQGKLNVERMPVGGVVATFCANKLVTDSAAAATALATGQKTNYRMVSVAPDGKPLKTLFEYAEEKGKSTGLAVTCSVTHATPAAFVAHAKSRNDYNLIAEHVAAANLEVLFGGGFSYFIPQGAPTSKRKDDKNLINVLAERMQIATEEGHFPGIDTSKPSAALIAQQHPAPSNERKLALKTMVAKAVEVLSSNKKGFVLVVEGAQIDWRGHGKDGEGVIRETVEFDDAVGAALDFAEKDKNTLVVVTSDHETGGMSIMDGSVAEKVAKTAFASGGHTGEVVPLFAYGPGSAAFGGFKDNTDIGKQLIDYVK